MRCHYFLPSLIFWYDSCRHAYSKTDRHKRRQPRQRQWEALPNVQDRNQSALPYFFFAIVGTTQDSQGFSAIDVAEGAISSAIDTKDAAKKFAIAVTPLFKAAVIQARKTNPASYKELLRSPEPLQVVFAAVEDGTPIFVVAYFSVVEKGRNIVVTPHETLCPGTGCDNGRGAIVLGENGAARQAVKQPDFWVGLDPLSAARKLVQLEITDRPDIVGPPISDLTLDSTGAHWGEKGECH